MAIAPLKVLFFRTFSGAIGTFCYFCLKFCLMVNSKNGIIGREKEQALIQEYYDSPKAELVAIYGRRRVGKTFLIKSFFNQQFDFYFIGAFETQKSIQLRLFQSELERYSGVKRKKPQDWFEAFEQLRDYLSSLNKERIVVFLDELPWMDTPKSNFIQAFSYFWNSWASNVNEMKFFVCGSATTWMLSKLIGDKGGMHGRVNRQIYLRPFNLNETEAFLRSKNIDWTQLQIAQTYMVMGGIPYYLDMLNPTYTAEENIDHLFFEEGAVLRTEYDFVFRSLFKDSSVYQTVIETLAKKSMGMTRDEIAQIAKLQNSGALTEVLENLRRCDFIRTYTAFGKKSHGQMFQLVDLFSLFHNRFISQTSSQDSHFWHNMQDNPARKTWEGYAFEQICLHHIPQIKQKLRIGGTLSEVCSWQCKPFTDKDGISYKGTQIDLLIDRRDMVIDLCEMKFSTEEYAITGEYDEHLRARKETFRAVTGTKKTLHTVFVTTYGLAKTKYSANVHDVVTLADLFEMVK